MGKIFYFHPVSTINYNGRLFRDNEPIIQASSRGLRYGDGLFETMKLRNGGLILSDEHFARLWKGMQLLQFNIPKLWSPERFTEQVLQLAMKNELPQARVRLTVVRGEGGIFEAADKTPNYIIETTPLPEREILNTNGLQMCIYRDAVKTIDSFSNLKHNNCLPYFMGALYAKQQQCNDALVLNSRGNICEATIANAFFIKDNVISTPTLSEGCIAGVMRKCLVEKIREQGFSVHETAITIADARAADEIFLSNSIYNCRWVADLEDKRYGNTVTRKIAETLYEKYPAIF